MSEPAVVSIEANHEPAPGVVPEAESEPEPPPHPNLAIPTMRQARDASRPALAGKLAQLAPIVPLADGRVALIWRHTTGAHACEAEVVLALLKPDGDIWTLESTAGLVDASTPWLDEDAPPPLAVTARAEDFDQDGESELLVRVRHPVMCPGGGPNTITSMFIYDAAPELVAALSTELHHVIDGDPEEGTEAIVRHEERDVVITYTSTSEGNRTTQTNRWVYQPETDAWAPKNPEYQRWGCDW